MSTISPAAISNLKQAQLQTQVQTAVTRKLQDVARSQGDAAVSLLQQAAEIQRSQVAAMKLEPHKGASIDVLA